MNDNKMEFMFDTVAFNRFVENKVDLSILVNKDHGYFATHIQRDELQKTSDQEKRNKLMKVFYFIIDAQYSTESSVVDLSRVDGAKIGGTKMVPTESGVWGISCWGQCKWTADDNLFEPIKKALDEIKKKKSNTQDALIAETSIKNHYILVTDDLALIEAVNKYGGKTKSFNDFVASL